jgi:hypothetical protein
MGSGSQVGSRAQVIEPGHCAGGTQGSATADKKRQGEINPKHLDAAWTEEVMPLFDLRAGHDSLHRELEGVASIKSGEIIEKSPGETSVRAATLATFLIASIA